MTQGRWGRPVCIIPPGPPLSFWEISALVQMTLKNAGYRATAGEFLRRAMVLQDDPEDMTPILNLAMDYVDFSH